jgi:peptidyl-prolyl cis-trans isomerase C
VSSIASSSAAPGVTDARRLRHLRTSGARRWLREPLLHFLLLGAALFAVYAYLQPGGTTESSKQIVLSLDELGQLDQYFESQWHRPPTPEELQRLVENKVQEEVLYREALAMGLDKNDTIVRRRMAQKMQFLAEDVAAAHEPSTDELRTWFDSNAAKFALPGRVAFRHIYFSPDRRGQRAREDATRALETLAGQPEDSPRAASLADPFMFQEYYADRTSEQLAKDFGPQFAQAVVQLTPGSWQGPIESGYGWHVAFVSSFVPGRTPAFEEIEPDVKTAWLAEQKQEAWRKAYDAMRAKYTVLLPAPPDAQSPPAVAAPSPSDIPGASDVVPE